jgi:hypothetical protein
MDLLGEDLKMIFEASSKLLPEEKDLITVKKTNPINSNIFKESELDSSSEN